MQIHIDIGMVVWCPVCFASIAKTAKNCKNRLRLKYFPESDTLTPHILMSLKGGVCSFGFRNFRKPSVHMCYEKDSSNPVSLPNWQSTAFL